MHRIAVLASEDCVGGCVTGTLDLFKAANTVWQRQAGEAAAPLFSWRVLTPDGTPVSTSTGIRLSADGSLADMDEPDALIVGSVHFESPEQLLSLAQALAPQLRPLAAVCDAGCILAASCTATVLLAEAGLLDGRRATTSWWIQEAFADRYPRVRLVADDMVVEDEDIVTGGAATAYLSVALNLVRRFAGDELALFCAKALLVDTNRNSQAPYSYLESGIRVRDPLVTRAETWMQMHLREEFTLEHLAEVLAVSPRTLIRRFKKSTGHNPAEYLTRLRIEEAKRLLERTTLPLEAVAERVGYRDPSSLRRVFRRTTHLSPGEFRKRFSIAENQHVV
ncbi:MAG: helix-turn-helix domain-containing protein [Gammaproteobacteria bacterium]